jgi:hypothetical protein
VGPSIEPINAPPSKEPINAPPSNKPINAPPSVDEEEAPVVLNTVLPAVLPTVLPAVPPTVLPAVPPTVHPAAPPTVPTFTSENDKDEREYDDEEDDGLCEYELNDAASDNEDEGSMDNRVDQCTAVGPALPHKVRLLLV